MSKVFFDTNLFIYMFEGVEPNRTRMLEIRKRMLERGDRIVTSSMTLGEVLVKPTKLGQTSLIEQYDRAIRSSAQIINFDTSVAWRYASLRATHTFATLTPSSWHVQLILALIYLSRMTNTFTSSTCPA